MVKRDSGIQTGKKLAIKILRAYSSANTPRFKHIQSAYIRVIFKKREFLTKQARIEGKMEIRHVCWEDLFELPVTLDVQNDDSVAFQLCIDSQSGEGLEVIGEASEVYSNLCYKMGIK